MNDLCPVRKHVRWLLAIGWLLLTLGLTASTAVAADEGGDDAMLRQAHAWARFGRGAWRQARIVTENFDDDGKLASSSVTDNRTMVEDVSAGRVTLRIEATIEIAGQKVPAQPQVVKQG